MIVKPSIAFNDFSGTAKDVTARNVNGRNILSLRAKHSKIVTPAQAVTRNKLSKISRAYKQLSDSQMMAWEVLASHMKGISTFGSAAQLTAHNTFVRINSNRAMVGMPLLEDAPVYTKDVPEVIYEDLWISPQIIIFTGLEVPADSYRLVVKMSSAQSTGTTNGWSKTVIVAPGVAPDYGDADVTKLYTETIGMTPELGKKYYMQCWWLDVNTGFTGESTWVSAICDESSTAYGAEYVPRARVTMNDISESEGYEQLDLDLSNESAIFSVDAMYSNATGMASGEFTLSETTDRIPMQNALVLGRCTREERNYHLTPCMFAAWFRTSNNKTTGTFAHRGGFYAGEHVEIFSTAPMYK